MREYTVDHEFEELERSRVSTSVTGVADAIASNGDSGTVGISFLGPYFADNRCIRDLFAAVMRDVVILDGKEGGSTFNSFASAIWPNSNALTKATEFVGARGLPNLGHRRG